jgi:uncharacterized protein (DUF488 family)
VAGLSGASSGSINPMAISPTIWTVGYERLLPAELIAELKVVGVRRLIDVRFRPQSRRAGMSKTRLDDALGEHGIAYEHHRELGTPADIRWFYRHNRVAEGAAQFKTYIEEASSEELDTLAAQIAGGGPPTALLCLEADPAECHRRIITERLTVRIPRLRVIDL